MNHTGFFRKTGFHILFWILFVSVISFLTSLTGRFGYSIYLINTLYNLPVYLLFVYPTIGLLNRKPGIKRGFVLSVSFVVLLSFVCSFLIILVNHFLFYRYYLPAELEPLPWFMWERLFQNLFIIWIPGLFFAVLYYFRNWQKEVIDKKELEKKQLETELKFLKSQLNPHFLLNTLNNLYALATINSDKIASSIQHLSDLFRIVLYESGFEKYPLTREAELIKSYIELQRLRFDSDLNCCFEMEGNIGEWEISPMLLFNFIENCFKHSNHSESGLIEIDIRLKCSPGLLEFQTKNSVSGLPVQQMKNGSGIGIENTRKRLELQYKGIYHLEHFRKDDFYFTNLSISGT